MTAAAPSPAGAEPGLTQALARYAVQARYAALPAAVRHEATRTFVNWLGCVLGGCREPAVALAAQVAVQLGGRPQADLIGRGVRSDIANAAFVNCIASSVQAFDDAHLATVTHPSGPAGASLFALSQTRRIGGEDFLGALALSVELQCRMANTLSLPPSQINVGFYLTGLSGPIGAAAGLGNLLGLDEQRMAWAFCLAASQGGGFRSSHGTMTAHFRAGHATRSGVWAALLADKGFDGDATSLEADKGFLDVYAAQADPALALRGLGVEHEMLRNSYKPYPCGIVIHPTLDACLDIQRRLDRNAALASVTLRVHPLALKLTGVRRPATPLESHVSLYHWAAAALLRGRAGLQEVQQSCIDDPAVAALRERVEAVVDPSLGRDQAVAEVTLADGRRFSARTEVTRGSATRPLTDDEVDAKFRDQASTVLPAARVDELLAACRGVASLQDVGREIGALLG
jgi:2-methylcitrate dehydratase PrpD